MSGIYGYFGTEAKQTALRTDGEKLRLWNKAYGTDNEETFIGTGAFLGCFSERFSNAFGMSSPVLKKDGNYAVIDAVLYNREELLEKTGVSEACSDEELLLSCIDKYGIEGLKEVNGDFCGAIYEEAEQKVTLFRDHLGVRPLFYYMDNEFVVFSTDMRGLLAMQGVDDAVDEKWLWSKLFGTGYMSTETTEFAHIFCVKPASYMTFSLKETGMTSEKKEYWRLGSKKIRLSSEQAYINRLKELITDAVKRRLDAVSGSVGAELSGGLDSGVISILIHRLGRDCTYFSWSASPEDIPYAENDERKRIDDICKQEGITCNYGGKSVVFSEDSIPTEKVRQIGLDPVLNEGPYRMYVLPPYVNSLTISETSQFMNRRGINVVFTGHGGDEGVSHRGNPYELFYHKEYGAYWNFMWPKTKGWRIRPYQTLKLCYKNLSESKKQLRGAYENVFLAKNIIKKEFCEKCAVMERPSLKFAYDSKAYILEGGSRNRLDVMALLGAYSGARYMVPYLDYRLVDFAVSIPRHMFLKHKKNRYIFREAFKDIMPESLYTVTAKESGSWANYHKEQQSEEEYKKQKGWYVSLLDRKYWDAYLDWNALENWAAQERSEENVMKDKGTFRCISMCVLLQNVVTRSKEVHEPQDNI
ncbi:MAG: hypothetical protein IKT67_00545 [Lachnospiraceae bacterium]|nr:hypothetical protein [Lachnospiraceae bacterium]